MSVYPWLEFKWWMIGLTVPWGKMQSLIQSIGYTIQQSVKGRLNCFHYSDAVEVHAVGTPDYRLLAPETGHRILKPNRLQTNSLTHDSMGHMFHVQFSPLLSLSLSLSLFKISEMNRIVPREHCLALPGEHSLVFGYDRRDPPRVFETLSSLFWRVESDWHQPQSKAQI